jgi:hypothetical protein
MTKHLSSSENGEVCEWRSLWLRGAKAMSAAIQASIAVNF